MVPLVEELIPCPDPWAVARKLAHLPHLLFLDSADRHPERGRYSYVTADPIQWFDEFLPPIHSATSESRTDLPPFQGGLAGLFGYGLGRTFEAIPAHRIDDLTTPDVALGHYDFAVSFDHLQRRAWIVTTGSVQRLKQIRECLELPTPERFALSGLRNELTAPAFPLPGHPGITSNFSPAEYRDAVRRAIEYVHAGDVFQVNIAQRLLAPLAEHPLELYGRLRERNPAPFACYFDAGEFQIASASPERFLKVTNGEVVTQPIKGTRPRGRTVEEDAKLLHDLITNPKDRAENVMIVDLLRNDLGRVCEFGSVRVPKVCEVETYQFVHHLVSEVRGKLRAGTTPFDLLKAAFPGGSVTGAPKVRAMEIIAELEPTARGPYCGSVGFIGFDGSMDTNILIRTFTAANGWLQFPVGGGIVADSDPDREYEETLHKAAGLLRALQP